MQQCIRLFPNCGVNKEFVTLKLLKRKCVHAFGHYWTNN